MATDLTLEQVNAAGRFAWHDHSSDEVWVYVPGHGIVYIEPWYNRVEFLTDEEVGEVFDSGSWHHLPGCDCEFCTKEAQRD